MSNVSLKMRVVGASIEVNGSTFLTPISTFNLNAPNANLEIKTCDDAITNRLQKAFVDNSLVTVLIKLKN